MPGEVVHLLEEVPLAHPFWCHLEAVRGEPFPFLLDSANPMNGLGSHSFIGGKPVALFRGRRVPGTTRASIDITEGPEAQTVRVVGDPFAELRRLLARWQVPREVYHARPVPFLAGAVGYFAYEARHYVEPLPGEASDPLGLPDVSFALYDAVLAHHHASGKTYLSVIGRGPTPADARRQADRTRDEWLARLRRFTPAPAAPPAEARTPAVHSNFDRPAYTRAVQACREHIFAGDLFEVCLTRRLRAAFTGDPWRLYQHLRRLSPAPFACYLEYPEGQVVSSSPERFVRLGADRTAESRPIKGTRPRGKTPAEDDALRHDLATSEKDRAENLMIVDLVRNDLGRVCEPGTVAVPELLSVEGYATLFQMVSTVRGQLRDDLDGLDLVKACFPGGSMTGAPKIEAMKVIDRLEGGPRGVYSGAIGYLDYAGPLDLNIVIRTLLVAGGECHFGTGGAVVADSDPDAEYDETVAKVRALVAAVASGGAG